MAWPMARGAMPQEVSPLPPDADQSTMGTGLQEAHLAELLDGFARYAQAMKLLALEIGKQNSHEALAGGAHSVEEIVEVSPRQCALQVQRPQVLHQEVVQPYTLQHSTGQEGGMQQSGVQGRGEWCYVQPGCTQHFLVGGRM